MNPVSAILTPYATMRSHRYTYAASPFFSWAKVGRPLTDVSYCRPINQTTSLLDYLQTTLLVVCL